MIRLKMPATFFDRPRVMKKVDAGRRRALSKAGGYIRQAAKNSLSTSARARVRDLSPRARAIYKRQLKAYNEGKRKTRPRPRKVSRPGNPPAAPRSSPLNRLLFFGYDKSRRSVVIGPAKFRKGKAPRILEIGGRSTRGVGKSKRSVVIRPRPYMAPALEASRNRIPEQFRNQIIGP